MKHRIRFYKRILSILLVCSWLSLFQTGTYGQTVWELISPLVPAVKYNEVHFIDENQVWACGDHGVLIKSMDGGISWQYFEQNEKYDYETLFFIDHETGWLGGLSGLFKTVDGGVNWFDIELNMFAKEFKSIVFVDSMTGWANINNDLYYTSDGGYSWEVRMDTLDGIRKIEFPSSQYGYLITYDALLYRTQDDGENWSAVQFQGELMDLCFLDATKGWLLDENGKIYKTTDGGMSFDTLYLNHNEECSQVHFYNDMQGIVLEEDFYEFTQDGGVTWTSVELTPWSSYSFRGGSSENGIFIILDNDGKILFSDDYGLTYEVPEVPVSWNLHSIVNTDDGRLFAAGGDQVLNSEDQGHTWESQQIALNSYIREICFVNNEVGYGIAGGEVFKTSDSGASWEVLTDLSEENFYSIFFLDENWGILVGGEGMAFKTMDGGQTWTDVYPGVQSDLYDVHFFNPDHGIVVGLSETYLVTDNGGQTWESNDPGIEDHFKTLYFLDNQTGFLSGNQKIYKTVNGGETWTQVWWSGGSGTSNSIKAIEFSNNLFGWVVGWDGLMLQTVDGGDFWVDFDQTGIFDFTDVCFLNPNTGVAVGTNGLIYRTDRGSFKVPKVLSQPDILNFCEGFPDQIVMEVWGDSLNHQWFFEGIPIPGATANSLVFDTVKQEHSGHYKYRIWNAAGFDVSDPFFVTVRPPAEVLASPADTTVFETDTVVFNQSVSGALPMYYQWQKNGIDIPGANAHAFAIYGAQQADSGMYRCIVWNDCTVDTTYPAKLTVLPVSGMKDRQHPNPLQVFPNPVKDQLTFVADKNFRDIRFTVFDIHGNSVFLESVSIPGTWKADVGFLEKGIYLVRIISGQNVSIIKFVKQ